MKVHVVKSSLDSFYFMPYVGIFSTAEKAQEVVDEINKDIESPKHKALTWVDTVELDTLYPRVTGYIKY